MAISRREFVTQSSSLLFSAQPFLKTFAANLYNHKKIVVLVHLAGGNDWINTIIPYLNREYYKARPSLAVSPRAALPLDNNLAFHPALSQLQTLYDQNQIAILLNVGSDRPTLSHYKAMEILQDKDISEVSWLGRYAELSGQTADLVFPAVNVEPFLTKKNPIIHSSLSRENQFSFDVDIHYRLDSLKGDFIANKPAESENQNPFVHGLNHISDLITQNYNATVYNISLGGFDTHCNQLEQHSSLLSMLSTGILSFQQNLEHNGLANQVLTVIYSEFGRSLDENNDKGTDHGLTNHILVIGNNVKGGIYGQYNLLSSCYQFDFRQVYATLSQHWLGCPNQLLSGEQWQPMDFIIDRHPARLG